MRLMPRKPEPPVTRTRDFMCTVQEYMSTPGFCLVGAPKAGTTSLFRYLGQHPEIALPGVKEPCFFAPEVPVDPATDQHRRSWDAYLSLFAGAGGARAVGE